MISDESLDIMNKEFKDTFTDWKYVDFQSDGDVILDDSFTLEELEHIIQIMKKYGENK